MISFCTRIYCDYSDFWKFIFSQGIVAMQLRYGGIYLVTATLQIFHRICRWKGLIIGQYSAKIRTKICGLLFWPTL